MYILIYVFLNPSLVGKVFLWKHVEESTQSYYYSLLKANT